MAVFSISAYLHTRGTELASRDCGVLLNQNYRVTNCTVQSIHGTDAADYGRCGLRKMQTTEDATIDESSPPLSYPIELSLVRLLKNQRYKTKV